MLQALVARRFPGACYFELAHTLQYYRQNNDADEMIWSGRESAYLNAALSVRAVSFGTPATNDYMPPLDWQTMCLRLLRVYRGYTRKMCREVDSRMLHQNARLQYWSCCLVMTLQNYHQRPGGQDGLRGALLVLRSSDGHAACQSSCQSPMHEEWVGRQSLDHGTLGRGL